MEHGVRDFVALRMKALSATPGFVGGQGARERLIARYAAARALGLVHERVTDRDRAVAQLMFFSDPEAWFGGPVVPGWIDRDPADARSLDPLLAAVDAHAARLGPDTLLEIRVDDGPLLTGLVARGFGIDSVIQLGDPRVALAALEGGHATVPAGLALEPLTPSRVPAVVELHRQVFSAEPRWCWFGAYPRHLTRMARDLAAHPEGHFALVGAEPGGRLVGHLGAELSDDPFWGAVGGLELVLAPELRGRGLARWIYREALRSLVERGARAIKGGTAQPAIMSLGRRMQRPWHVFNLRRDVHFAPEHFLRFAPESVRRAHAG